MIVRDTEKWLEPHNITNLRNYLQLTQVEFAKALGLASKTFAKYETGICLPQKATRVLLSIISEQPFLLLDIMEPDLAMRWKKRIGQNKCGSLVEEYSNILKKQYGKI
jgi:DNA-binding XRE family transcriptional regulator